MVDRMSNEYPLYPTLGETGENESQKLIDKFKVELKKAADEVIGNLYTDVALYIESDSWGNFRNQIMDGFKNYDNRKIQGEYDFKEIRQSILQHHREDIINDLNQDMVNEISSLKEQIEYLNRRNY